MEPIELNWLYKHTKNVSSSQAAILVQNWIKYSFSLWLSLKDLVLFDICAREICQKVVYKHLEAIEYVKNLPTF